MMGESFYCESDNDCRDIYIVKSRHGRVAEFVLGPDQKNEAFRLGRLFSAAPELLDALSKFVSFTLGELPDMTADELMEYAKAAMNKTQIKR